MRAAVFPLGLGRPAVPPPELAAIEDVDARVLAERCLEVNPARRIGVKELLHEVRLCAEKHRVGKSLESNFRDLHVKMGGVEKKVDVVEKKVDVVKDYTVDGLEILVDMNKKS